MTGLETNWVDRPVPQATVPSQSYRERPPVGLLFLKIRKCENRWSPTW